VNGHWVKDFLKQFHVHNSSSSKQAGNISDSPTDRGGNTSGVGVGGVAAPFPLTKHGDGFNEDVAESGLQAMVCALLRPKPRVEDAGTGPPRLLITSSVTR